MAKQQETEKKVKNVDKMDVPDLEKLAHVRDDLGANMQSVRVQIIALAGHFTRYHAIGKDGKLNTKDQDYRVKERALDDAAKSIDAIKIYMREIGANLETMEKVLN